MNGFEGLYSELRCIEEGDGLGAGMTFSEGTASWGLKIAWSPKLLREERFECLRGQRELARREASPSTEDPPATL